MATALWVSIGMYYVLPSQENPHTIRIVQQVPFTPTPVHEQPVIPRPTKEPIVEIPVSVSVGPNVSTPNVLASSISIDTRPDAIRKVLNGMPLYDIAQELVDIADRYALDWRLLPALGLHESTGGKFPCAPGNAWGWGCPVSFSTWERGANIVANGLTQDPYRYRTLSGILAVYNPDGGTDYIDEVMATIYQLEAAR